MAKNMIQFQKGKSIHEFLSEYGTEDKCQDSLFRLRWPHGFSCPNCGGSKFCELKSRDLYQCHKCHHQASVK
ncbi:transposase, partial [Desulforegula conservatrix]